MKIINYPHLYDVLPKNFDLLKYFYLTTLENGKVSNAFFRKKRYL